jgi:hypothetical protein
MSLPRVDSSAELEGDSRSGADESVPSDPSVDAPSVLAADVAVDEDLASIPFS